VQQSPLARCFLGASVIFFSASLCPSNIQQSLAQHPGVQQLSVQQPSQPQQPAPQAAAPRPSPSSTSSQTKKPAAGSVVPQSTHFPILLLIEGKDQSWSLRIGQKGPERLDRVGYPPIPLDPGAVVREGATDTWTYNAKDSQTGAAVAVHLTRENCADNASAVKYVFTASVDHAQIGPLQGCGRVATELFPRINNQPLEDDDETKDKPAPPTVTHFKPPVAVAYITGSDRLIVKRGAVARTVPGTGGYQPALSHDGKRLLYTTAQKGAAQGAQGDERTIFLYDWATGKSSELLRGAIQRASWSPDDARIAFTKFDGSKWQLWTTPADAPDKAALVYPGEALSMQGWADAHTIIAGDLQTLSWIGDDGIVKQTLSSADLYGKDQFGLSSGNTVRIHPLNPDLLLVSAELLPAAVAALKVAASKDASNKGNAGQSAQVFFLYEIRSKRRVLLSPPNMSCSDAEWSRDGLQIFFTGRQTSGGAAAVYRVFWDGTSQVKVHDGYNFVIGE
jgi:uncharacterized membrane protein